MKIIYLLILSLFISFNANAVDIYKCEIDKRTEIASCGFYNTCINIIITQINILELFSKVKTHLKYDF